MSFKKVGMVRKGLEVGGYSVAKYRDDKTRRVKLCLMRNGRSVARKEFDHPFEFTIWCTEVLGPDLDGHDTIVKLTKELRK